ncbi:TOTE conflict system archaeo-eukaryotic primase domain-containing protein [Rhizobium sp. BK176]|uniref:TOTE conflict system archaeo-eukaryotic primase domain-containing protein n=1 Tax=Rhizobium sp. BK176 TaxID=2587071 RepID=UPI0021675CED|nr:DEAD/DEAH box helicase family protein [Rhizobium sp. BK176]MCS4089246.1 superfamily II DNA or RNA helicase [Rhizobium sp. BK176]
MRRASGDQHSDLPLFGLAAPVVTARIDRNSPLSAKVNFLLGLFGGHDLHVGYRWENNGRIGTAILCDNEWDKELCQKGGGGGLARCESCPNKSFVVNREMIMRSHLAGSKQFGKVAAWRRDDEFVAAVYPVAADGTCRFFCVGFVSEGWRKDAEAFLETTKLWRIPAAVEAGRDGRGARVWVFFQEGVPARKARELAYSLVTETMDRRPELAFSTYDLVWPAENSAISPVNAKPVPLPLQMRQMALGYTVFLDDQMNQVDDQWLHLDRMKRLSLSQLDSLLGTTKRRADRVLGVRLVAEGDFDTTVGTRPSGLIGVRPVSVAMPPVVDVLVSNQVYIDRSQLPAQHAARLMSLAAFQNPVYLKAQKDKRDTRNQPLIISRGQIDDRFVALPRGCLPDVLKYLEHYGAAPRVEDKRNRGQSLPSVCRFTGTLEPSQQLAYEALMQHDIGVVEGPPSFGKTVVAAAMIGGRGVNSLVLVNRSHLLTQWKTALPRFLDIDPSLIGTIVSGKWNHKGVIDIAVIQGLKGEDRTENGLVLDDLSEDFIAGYGNIIVDECHHIAAVTYEAVTKRAPALYFSAFSATTKRGDGKEPVVFMQCGPIRHRTTAEQQAAERGIRQTVLQRRTATILPPEVPVDDPNALQAIYKALAEDEGRNDQIFEDVIVALSKGRSPIVISERRDHLEVLAKRFEGHVDHLAVMHGQMKKAAREKAEAALAAPLGEQRLILATGGFLGEGFDDSRLSALFLTMPISTEGWLKQYTGRLQRKQDGKEEIEVYDYLDYKVQRLVNMWKARQRVYTEIGFDIVRDTSFMPEFDEGDWELVQV